MPIDYDKRREELYVDEKLKMDRAQKEAAEKIKEAQQVRAKGGHTPSDQMIRESITGHKEALKPSQIHEMAQHNAKVQLINEQKAQKMGLGPENIQAQKTKGQRAAERLKAKRQQQKEQSRTPRKNRGRERDRDR